VVALVGAETLWKPIEVSDPEGSIKALWLAELVEETSYSLRRLFAFLAFSPVAISAYELPLEEFGCGIQNTRLAKIKTQNSNVIRGVFGPVLAYKASLRITFRISVRKCPEPPRVDSSCCNGSLSAGSLLYLFCTCFIFDTEKLFELEGDGVNPEPVRLS
jgi:hypothetical protein